MTGNLSVPDNNRTADPVNQFDSYRMAAVYSERFWTGAGTRLFYHTSASNGTSWVQEWIWTQSTDNWRIGQPITNVYPNSHLAATVDEQNSLLRLYFASGNLTLQEVWLNISDPNGLYNNGRPVIPRYPSPLFSPFSRLISLNNRLLLVRIPPPRQRRPSSHLLQRHNVHLPPLQYRRPRPPRTHRLRRAFLLQSLRRLASRIIQFLRTPCRQPHLNFIRRHEPLFACWGGSDESAGVEGWGAIVCVLGGSGYRWETCGRRERDGVWEFAADL